MDSDATNTNDRSENTTEFAGQMAPIFGGRQPRGYPVSGYDFDTPSYRKMTQAKPLSSPTVKWFFENYLRSPSDGQLPNISLDRADLAGLPSATIVSAEFDPLRSEGEALACASAASHVGYTPSSCRRLSSSRRSS